MLFSPFILMNYNIEMFISVKTYYNVLYAIFSSIPIEDTNKTALSFALFLNSSIDYIIFLIDVS
jgi:hypothetical protein